jgi:hypothetical protein
LFEHFKLQVGQGGPALAFPPGLALPEVSQSFDESTFAKKAKSAADICSHGVFLIVAAGAVFLISENQIGWASQISTVSSSRAKPWDFFERS